MSAVGPSDTIGVFLLLAAVVGAVLLTAGCIDTDLPAG
jgi:outer membrane murein-binding lipoprotein Lpp